VRKKGFTYIELLVAATILAILASAVVPFLKLTVKRKKEIQLRRAFNRKIRFLRRIPIDPMTGKAEWGLRSVQDDPDSTTWGGQNVYDVYSLSEGTAIDGTKYKDW